MPRFKRNRWWAFILALSLALTCGLALTPVDGVTEETPDPNEQPISDIGGDPDRPMAPKGAHRGFPYGGGMGVEQTTVGDGGWSMRDWMWRLRFVGLSLRSFYFRY